MTLTDSEASAVLALAITATPPAYSMLDVLLAKGAIRLKIDGGDFCYLIAEWAMHQARAGNSFTRRPEPEPRGGMEWDGMDLDSAANWATANWTNTSTASGGPTVDDLLRFMRAFRT